MLAPSAARLARRADARRGSVGRRLRVPLAIGAVLMASACGHMPQVHWPWQRRAAPPQEVHELRITGQGVPAFPQYWKDNTLIIDMKGAGSQGSVVLAPREHTLWPARLAFRVTPGEFGELDIRGNQRLVLPITSDGSRPVDLELPPRVYLTKTPQISVTWGPVDHSSGD